MTINSNEILLPVVPFAMQELGDHPVELTDEEATAGEVMYHEVDDLDDLSNGVFESPEDILTSGHSTALARAQIVRGYLLKHGVPEVSIELEDGRPGTGDTWNLLNPVAVISHHIASHPTPANPTPGLSLVKAGRSDLPGPLCNGTAGVDLVYRIVCLGMANHPGLGGPWTITGPMGTYTIPQDNARYYAWGTEYEGGYDNATWDKTYTNKRTQVSMTFREFMGRANAALVEAIWAINTHGRHPKPSDDLAGYHGEHKTWAPTRKIDRLDYTTTSGRVEIDKWDSKTLPAVYVPNMLLAAQGKVKRSLPGVKRVQRALRDTVASSLKITGHWDDETKAAYKVHQRKIGAPAKFIDGTPGPRDLAPLAGGRFRLTGI